MSDAACGERYLDVDGARLRYRDEGRGPAVVFVHGWTLDLDMWEPQCAALRETYRVVRYDRRGFGLSSGVPGHLADLADLRSVCRALGLARIALVGMSQGARAAAGLAAESPASVWALVLHGPPELGGDAAAGTGDVPIAEYRELIRAGGLAAFRREWAKHPLMRLRTPDPRVHERVRTMLARYPGLDLLAEPSATAAPAAPAPSGRILAPSLLITGAGDIESRTRAADALGARIPHAERAIVPDAGHLANLDNPDAYNRILRSFLDRHARTPT